MSKPLFNFITLFPKELEASLSYGVLGQAVAAKLVQLNFVNPRTFTTDRHHAVDDRPYGGGDGMLMTTEPLDQSLVSLGDQAGHVVYLTPQGRLWSNELAQEWSRTHTKITFVCGRYAGIDDRWIKANVREEISVGDYILSGAETAAQIVVDSITRFVPGVLGNEKSSLDESLQGFLLEAPQFTRPPIYRGFAVPDTLMSGHHERIAKWKRFVSIARTAFKRPDLLQKALEVGSVNALELKAAREFVKNLPPEEIDLLGLGEYLSRE